MSAESGQKVWEANGEVDGKMCEPHGILFSSQHQVLLIADGSNCRVLVMHPRDGSHLQTIELEWKKQLIVGLCIHQNKLVVWHHDAHKLKISYFAIH